MFSIGFARSVVVGICLSALLPLELHAGFINNTFGLTNPTSVITFDEIVFAPGTTITNQYAGLGVSFTPNVKYTPQAGQWNNITGNWVGNFQPITNPILLTFNDLQQAVAFALITNDGGQTTFTAKLNGVTIESVTASTGISSNVNFYGFKDIVFNEIEINVVGNPVNLAFGLDNLQMQTVPVPSAVMMSVIGFATLFAMRFISKSKKPIIV